jgi:hypothetical protein
VCFVVPRGVDGATFRFEPHDNVCRFLPKEKVYLKIKPFFVIMSFVVPRVVDGATFRFEPHDNVSRTTCSEQRVPNNVSRFLPKKRFT